MKSIWTDTSENTNFQQLNENIKTDTLIIGGGMTGILCAYFLKQKGVDYALVEAKKIGNGITKNTTAKITSQHGLTYDNLIKKSGVEKAQMYFNANELAIQRYHELTELVPCEFEEKSAFVYSTDDRGKIEREVYAASKLGAKAEFVSEISPPVNIAGAIKFNNQAQFNPLKFIDGISKDLNIYENTFVQRVEDNVAYTDNGNITAKSIIIATHFPFINSHGSYFLKMYQHRSYVIALENAQNVNGMFVDEKQNGLSFRNYQGLLFVGGGDHKTGKQGGGFNELRNFSKTAYLNAIEKYCWATQDCMTLDGVPYIGRYSKLKPNMYVATGFNKWGMTSSMVSAMILSDMITEKPNEVAEVFSPSRSMLKKQLLINGVEAITNLATFSTKRCSHLGCSLKWNKIQRSWDCPCHGSRFDEKGNLIDNPAMKGVNVD